MPLKRRFHSRLDNVVASKARMKAVEATWRFVFEFARLAWKKSVSKLRCFSFIRDSSHYDQSYCLPASLLGSITRPSSSTAESDCLLLQILAERAVKRVTVCWSRIDKEFKLVGWWQPNSMWLISCLCTPISLRSEIWCTKGWKEQTSTRSYLKRARKEPSATRRVYSSAPAAQVIVMRDTN